jgi:Rab GDP dissociation inhibitor
VEDLGEYDIIICGTSIKECLLSGFLSSCEGKKILHIDRNSYYGGDAATFNLEQVHQKFRPGTQADTKTYGRSNNWYVDLCPKFLLGDGLLVRCLSKTIPSDYMSYRTVAGSYVYHVATTGMFTKTLVPGLHQIPMSAKAGLNSSLLSGTAKIRFPLFVKFVYNYNPDDEKTWKGTRPKEQTMQEIYDAYSIDAIGRTFTSHALALESTEDHLTQPAEKTILKIQLYAHSLARFEVSPYLYVQQGLGNICESYSRLSSICGGTFITCCKDIKFTTGANGEFTGMNFTHDMDGGNPYTARAPMILGDPSYFDESMFTQTGQICRSICILQNQVAQAADNCQVIVPGKEVKRTTDTYISALSSNHGVCPQGKYFAVVSTTNEGALCANIEIPEGGNAEVKATCDRELAIAYQLLSKENKILERYDWVDNQKSPNATLPPGFFMTSSLDAETHFGNVMDEVFNKFREITGKTFNLAEVRSQEEMREAANAAAEAAYAEALEREKAAQAEAAAEPAAEPAAE